MVKLVAAVKKINIKISAFIFKFNLVSVLIEAFGRLSRFFLSLSFSLGALTVFTLSVSGTCMSHNIVVVHLIFLIKTRNVLFHLTYY